MFNQLLNINTNIKGDQNQSVNHWIEHTIKYPNVIPMERIVRPPLILSLEKSLWPACSPLRDTRYKHQWNEVLLQLEIIYYSLHAENYTSAFICHLVVNVSPPFYSWLSALIHFSPRRLDSLSSEQNKNTWGEKAEKDKLRKVTYWW